MFSEKRSTVKQKLSLDGVDERVAKSEFRVCMNTNDRNGRTDHILSDKVEVTNGADYWEMLPEFDGEKLKPVTKRCGAVWTVVRVNLLCVLLREKQIQMPSKHFPLGFGSKS